MISTVSALLVARAYRHESNARIQVQQTLARSDLEVGVARIQQGQAAQGLAYLARSMRSDPELRPAAVQTLMTLASGRCMLDAVKTFEQSRPIAGYRLNSQRGLLFTWDASPELPTGQRAEGFVWDLRTGQQLYQVSPGKRFAEPDWSEDGDLLITWLVDENGIQAWESSTGRPVGELLRLTTLGAMKHRTDPALGRLVLARNKLDGLQVFRLDTGQAITPKLQRSGPPAGDFGFSPDGRTVFSAYKDKVVAFWETQGGALVHEFAAPSTSDDLGMGTSYLDPTGQFLVIRALDQRRIAWWQLGQPVTQVNWLAFLHPIEVVFLVEPPRLVVLPRTPAPGFAKAVVYDLSSRKSLATIRLNDSLLRCVYVADSPPEFATEYQNEYWRNPAVLRFPLLGTLGTDRVRVWDLHLAENCSRSRCHPGWPVPPSVPTVVAWQRPRRQTN